MKRILLTITVTALLTSGFWLALRSSTSQWKGVDEAVVEKFAQEAGCPPRQPYINTDQGDLLLFLFLLAGTVGGFVMGYKVRELFPPRGAATGEAP